MFCRIILIAVAISCMFTSEITLHARDNSPSLVQIKDVICVLLLSGLQKKDLDANTLEKLERHNVNIYDVNKESLRHECLLESYSNTTEKATYDVTEKEKYKSMTLENKRIDNKEANVAGSKLSEISAPNFLNEANLRHLTEEIHLRDGKLSSKDNFRMFQQMGNNFETEIQIKDGEKYNGNNIKMSNVHKNNQDDKIKRSDEIKSQQYQVTAKVDETTYKVEYLTRQSSLENLLSFWNELSHRSTSESISYATTTDQYLTDRENKIESARFTTRNTREMGYINRILREYLKSQTAPTDFSTTKMPNMDFILKKFENAMKGNKLPSSVFWNTKEISDFVSIGKIIPITYKIDYTTQKILSIYSGQDDNDYKYKEHTDVLKLTPYLSDSSRVIDNKQQKTKENVENLNDILRLSKEFNVKVQMPYLENITNFKLKNDNIRFQELRNSNKLHFTGNNNINDKRNAMTNNFSGMAQYEVDNDSESRLVLKNSVSSTNEIYTNSNKGSIKDQIGNITNNPLLDIPNDIIKAIAEKVKQIVIKDLKRVSTTYMPATSKDSMSTTTTPVITTIANEKEEITLLQKITEEKGQVMKTLMEILKGFKVLNDSIKSTTQIPFVVLQRDENPVTRNTPILNKMPTVITGFNPYDIKVTVPKIEQHMNTYGPSSLQVPRDPADNKALYEAGHIMQKNLHPKNRSNVFPITIQSNSDQIPPLAIQISSPMEIINKNIESLPQKTVGKEKDDLQQEITKRLDEKLNELLGIDKEKYRNIYNSVYNDLAKKLSITEAANRQLPDIHNNKFQILYDKVQNTNENNRQNARGFDRPSIVEYRVGKTRNEEPRYHKLEQILDTNHAISQHLNTNDGNQENYDRFLDFKRYNNFGRQWNSDQRKNFNWHGDNKRRETEMYKIYPYNRKNTFEWPDKATNKPMDFNHPEIGNRLMGIKHHTREQDPRTRELLTHEFVSRLMDSEQGDLKNVLVEVSPNNTKNRAVDQYHSNDSWDTYVRNEKQYPKAVKFHEKLERTENLYPYNSYNSKMTTHHGCEAIVSRQQMPISNMKYTRTRFDDTHFRNFLNTQQKVTDMLAKILASKTKTDFHSVEAF